MPAPQHWLWLHLFTIVVATYTIVCCYTFVVDFTIVIMASVAEPEPVQRTGFGSGSTIDEKLNFKNVPKKIH